MVSTRLDMAKNHSDRYSTDRRGQIDAPAMKEIAHNFPSPELLFGQHLFWIDSVRLVSKNTT